MLWGNGRNVRSERAPEHASDASVCGAGADMGRWARFSNPIAVDLPYNLLYEWILDMDRDETAFDPTTVRTWSALEESDLGVVFRRSDGACQ